MDLRMMPHDHDHDHDHGHDHARDGDDDNEVIVAKSVAMVVLFLASTILGLIPIVLARKLKWIKDDSSAADIKSKNKVVVGLLSFGGGVLLATTFLHLLPEVGENVEALQNEHVIAELSFHLESLLMCLGFFTMYFVEECVHSYLDRRSKRLNLGAESTLVRTLSVRHSRSSSKPPTQSTMDLIKNEPPLAVSTVDVSGDHQHHHNHHNHHHHHSHMPFDGDDSVSNSLRGLLIVLALSVHELFEGLSVGLEDSAESVWYMFGAVSAHKLVIAFCIGVELVASKTSTLLSVVYVVTFAIVSPVGIGIGLGLVGGQGAASSVASVILQGLASGTLLYVIFFEILQKERSGFLQMFSALFGFIVMFGLQFAFPHEHEHSHC